MGIDIAARNADDTDNLPMPTVVIVDAAGVIRWITSTRTIATRTETEQILGALSPPSSEASHVATRTRVMNR